MSIFFYIMLFMVIQQLMWVSPMLGILCYVAIFYYISKSNKRRRQSFNQNGYQRTYYSNQGQQTQDPRVVNAIDIEFTEEEIS